MGLWSHRTSHPVARTSTCYHDLALTVTTMPTEKNFGMRLAPHERRQIERLAEARETTMKEAVHW